jgi:hypothetical protein
MARTLFLVGLGIVIVGTLIAWILGSPIAEAGYAVVFVTALVLAFRFGLPDDGGGGHGGGAHGAGGGDGGGGGGGG